MITSRMVLGATVALVAGSLVLGGALLMLWGGYGLLAHEIGPELAALGAGAVPIAVLLVAAAVLAFRARPRRRAPSAGMLGELFDRGAGWAKNHPMEAVTLAFLTGTALGVSADARDGVVNALSQALRPPADVVDRLAS
jgi:hypothetical protein